MQYDVIERIPAAVALLRQLLWVESLPVRFADESTDAAAVNKLCKVGQTILQEDLDGDR